MMQRILSVLILLLVVTGLAVSGAHAATMMPDKPTAMAEGGMPICDGCGGNEGGKTACTMICGPSCAGDLGQLFGASTGNLAASGAVIVPGSAVPPGAALSPEPPRPKTHAL